MLLDKETRLEKLVKLKAWLKQSPGRLILGQVGVSVSALAAAYVTGAGPITVAAILGASYMPIVLTEKKYPMKATLVARLGDMFTNKRLARRVILQAQASVYALGGEHALECMEYAMESMFRTHHKNVTHRSLVNRGQGVFSKTDSGYVLQQTLSDFETAHDLVVRETLYYAMRDMTRGYLRLTKPVLPVAAQHYILERFPEWTGLYPETFSTDLLKAEQPDLLDMLCCVQGLYNLPEERAAVLRNWLDKQYVAPPEMTLPEATFV